MRSVAVPWWAEAAMIGLVSRVLTLFLVDIAALRAERLAPQLWAEPGGAFGIWDGQWYLRIAAAGYHASPIQGYQDFAFFPVWPLTIRVLSLGGLLPYDVVATVLANGLFIAGAVVMYRAFMLWGDRNAARVGLGLLAFGPAAYTFSLIYSESMFLLIAAVSFGTYGARRVGLVALAQLTRLTGLGLALGGLVEAVRSGRRREGAFVFAAGLAALAAWWVFIAVLTGDPLGYMRGTPSWREGATGVGSAVDAPFGLGVFALAYVALMFLGTLRLLRDRHLAVGVYCLFAVVTALLLGAWSEMPRYAMAAYPANVGLALLLPTTRSRVLLVVFFAALQAAWVLAIFSGFGTP